MPYYIKGIKASKLRLILIRERIGISKLHSEIQRQCNELGLKPVTQPSISVFSFGNKQDARMSTYLKILYALNSLRMIKPEPYTLNDIVDINEVLKPKKKVSHEQKG
jgi:hypothetical protein